MIRGLVFFVLCTVLRGYAPSGWRPAVRSGVALRRVTKDRFSSLILKAEGEESDTEVEVSPTATVAKEDDNEVTNSKVFLEKKIEVLKNDLASIEDEIKEAEARREVEWKEWGPQIEQLRTEFENVKKRESSARSSASSTEKANVLREIFPVTDNFDLAKDYIKPESDAQQAIADRYAAIHKDLMQVYADLGAAAIEEVGIPFDPELHTAAMFQPDPVHPEEYVSTILQKGFKVEDIVVRPATVIVSSGP